MFLLILKLHTYYLHETTAKKQFVVVTETVV